MIGEVLSAEEKGIALTRDTVAERRAAKNRQALQVGEIVAARLEGSLGEECIKLAQAMILCSLPYSKTEDRQVTRKARLGDGSVLSVTFIASDPGIPMPFGADRKLLAWIFDRAIRSESSYIPWNSASEYRRDMGLSIGGSANRQLASQFRRIAGLMINIQRHGEGGERGRKYPVMQDTFLPATLQSGIPDNQQSLPGLADRHGFVLSPALFEDIRRHFVSMPRKVWVELKGPNQVIDIVHWLFYRGHAAANESVIPWQALQEQFDPDQHLWRVKAHARAALRIVRTIWPTVRFKEVEQGIWVTYSPEALLPDDETKGRVRRLTARTR